MLCESVQSSLMLSISLSPSHRSVLQSFDLEADEIDLENEPWFKFFSELEFGRPVSGTRRELVCVCVCESCTSACDLADIGVCVGVCV